MVSASGGVKPSVKAFCSRQIKASNQIQANAKEFEKT